MSEMAKLAAQQQALRKSLAELNSEMKSRGGKSLGDLGKISKDMEAVVDDLRQNKFNRRTQMRQQQILQRLLSASRSMKKQDKSKERESKKAGNYLKREISDLPGDLGSKESILGMLREDVLKSDLSVQDKLDMEKYIEILQYSGE